MTGESKTGGWRIRRDGCRRKSFGGMIVKMDVIDLAYDSDTPLIVESVSAAAQPQLIDLAGDSSSDESGVHFVAMRNRRKRPRKEGGASTKSEHRLPSADGRETNSAAEAETTSEVKFLKQESGPLDRVLDVFPDADVKFVKERLAEMGDHTLVISYMLENAYPKLKQPKTKLKLVEDSTTYDFLSMESFRPSVMYAGEVGEQLSFEFPFLSMRSIPILLNKYQFHYAIVHDKLLRIIKGNKDEDTQYRQAVLILNSARTLSPEQVQQVTQLAGMRQGAVLKHPRRKAQPLLTDPVLVEEVKFVKQKYHQWISACNKRKDRAENKKIAQARGTGVDCSCCYDAAAVQDMVPCRDQGHLFCVDCLQAFAENQIFGTGNLGVDPRTKKPALELLCFHSDGCTSGFDRKSLEKALPAKVLAKHDELQCQVSVERAGMDDLSSCPKCDFQAAVAPSEKIFACPVCGFESCRECGEESHIPMRCDEVVKDREETKGRVSVEEAISEAKIRKCPKCSKSTIKSEGCNKITCGCGAKFCYICRVLVRDYTHFCQKPHCNHSNCSKCPLYTKDEDDIAAMRKAAHKAAASVAGSVQNLDVESMLRNNNTEAAKLKTRRGRLLDAIPEVTRLQSSKCYGFDAPGYDYLDYDSQISGSTLVGTSIRSYLNASFVYSQTPIVPRPLGDQSIRIDDVQLDTFHQHHPNKLNPDDSFPFYGYLMRVQNSYSASITIGPVSMTLGDSFNSLFGSNIDASDLHTCFSWERLDPTPAGDDSQETPLPHLHSITVAGCFDTEASPQEFFDSGSLSSTGGVCGALGMESAPIGNLNLEDSIYELYLRYLNGYAAGFELDWMRKFRTVTVVLDLSYPFLVLAQTRQNRQFPSARFNQSRAQILLHVLLGFLIIYIGVYLHIRNEIFTISKSEDDEFAGQLLYRIMGVAAIVHSASIFAILPKVMGEKRITIPLYFVAGSINLGNAIMILRDPTLQNAFLLWGSVNTFVYVRAFLLAMVLAHLDWELLYTYSVLGAAAITYPLTGQDIRVFYGYAAPIVYAPFHECVCSWFPSLGLTPEDTAGDNTPSKKNILAFTVAARAKVVELWRPKG